MSNSKTLGKLMEGVLESEEFTDDIEEATSEIAAETVISADVVIRGDILSHSSLKICGTVEGNVCCDGALTLYGDIHGDLECQSLDFYKGTVEGNVITKEWVKARKDTKVEGNISANNVQMAGQVKGSVIATKEFEVRRSAVIIGDVKTGSIAVCAGARLCGTMKIGEDLDVSKELNASKAIQE